MDETATRRKLIDPALYGVGWEQVPESEILTEQRAYQIAPGPAIPPLPEQQRIVERLDSLSKNVKALEENQRKVMAECDALKQALLRKVFV